MLERSYRLFGAFEALEVLQVQEGCFEDNCIASCIYEAGKGGGV